MKNFSKDFLWGASTSAYQAEGGLHTQWSEWEAANAGRLAREALEKQTWLPGYEALKPQLGNPANYINGQGVDHYNRYEADFDLLTTLNMNAFRFGIEWARVEPEEGRWDKAAIRHYRDYIAALKRRGIEPIPTLWHWTMPTWFTAKGGFEKRRNIRYFERFAMKVSELFGSDVRYILTLNEPNVYAGISYGSGEWPPQSKHTLKLFWVYNNLAVTHRRIYRALKRVNPSLQIGFPAHLADMRCSNPRNPFNQPAVRIASYVWNWWFLNRTRRQQDFIGLNYYFTEYRDWRGRVKNPPEPVSDLGWYMEPSGIYRLLGMVWRQYRKPILITENGLADAADKRRQWWLEETLQALEKAAADGVDLIGYLHWSLLDNFEWAYGWWPKFGLVAVDHTTMKRTIRPSAKWFGRQIKRYRS